MHKLYTQTTDVSRTERERDCVWNIDAQTTNFRLCPDTVGVIALIRPPQMSFLGQVDVGGAVAPGVPDLVRQDGSLGLLPKVDAELGVQAQSAPLRVDVNQNKLRAVPLTRCLAREKLITSYLQQVSLTRPYPGRTACPRD